MTGKYAVIFNNVILE